MQFKRSPGKKGSHFNPSSELFQPNEKKDIITSTTSWLAMVGILAGLTFVMGPIQMLKLYAVPYLVRATCPQIWAHVLLNDNLNGWGVCGAEEFM
jgi:omega-3 fatty acid desaturase (delta-15 desaturase)